MGRIAGTFTLEEKEQSSARMEKRRHQEKQESPTPLAAASLEHQVNDYLIIYNAGLLEIDRKYPLGDPERPEWIIAHRKNAVKRLKGIILGEEKA
jgi:hypothetical protein